MPEIAQFSGCGSLIDHGAMVGRFELCTSWNVAVPCEVVDAGHEYVVRCSDRSGCTAKLDHQSAPIGERGVAQHHEKIDIGVGSIGSISYGPVQDDALPIERAHDHIHELGHPLLQGTSGPYRTVVTHCIGDRNHKRKGTGSARVRPDA